MRGTCASKPRPTCATCDKKATAISNYYDEDGKLISTSWRDYCSTCHMARRKNYKKKMLAFNPSATPTCHVNECCEMTTLKGTDINGNLQFTKYCIYHSKYLGSMPLHLQWRKTYCENQDGRLGFKCTAHIPFEPALPKGVKWMFDYGFPQPMLTVDHKDGVPTNEPKDGSNFQTLCTNCHAWKTWKSGDGQTPGRKALKVHAPRMPKVKYRTTATA